MSAIQYIRDYYKVPAKVRGRVRITAYGYWHGHLGTVTGAENALIVRPDVRKTKRLRIHVHPREVEYLDTAKGGPR